MGQSTPKETYHDPQHGWVDGLRHSAPPRHAITKVFFEIMEVEPFDSDKLESQWWDQLPSVPVVTGLLLRQQSRRRWKPPALAHMCARFPRLQEVHYEPWREWNDMKIRTDKCQYFYILPAQAAGRSRLQKHCIADNLYLDFEYFFDSFQRSNNHIKRLTVFENFN